ncbi:MAG: ATP-NAD kinase family protein [Methyloligellaceae bacterium]
MRQADPRHEGMSGSRPLVGIVANPVSARDIRRVIANATSLQITDRANIVLRVLACLRSCGVADVLMMPEKGGIRGHVQRGLNRAANTGDAQFPVVHYVDMPVTGTVDDTVRAVVAMREQGVSALIVLGGDGTHRAVATACADIPIAGISTGTNNAFPEHREPTITGLAVGLAVTGRVPPSTAYRANKRLIVAVNDGETREVALVDVAVVSEGYVGARAVWRTQTFRELFVTFADPEVIGMSAIAGLLEPISRTESGGLLVRLSPVEAASVVLHTPIAPGLIRPVGIKDWRRIQPNGPIALETSAGTIALDGERELSFSERDHVAVTLEENAFRTVDAGACMHYAARNRLFQEVAMAAPDLSEV